MPQVVVQNNASSASNCASKDDTFRQHVAYYLDMHF